MDQESLFVLHYESRSVDFQAAQLFVHKRSSKKIPILVFAILTVVLLVLLGAVLMRAEWAIRYLFLIIGFVIFYFFTAHATFSVQGVVRRTNAMIKALHKKSVPVVGKRTVVLTPTGICVSSENSKTEWAWNAVSEITRSERHIFIMLQQNTCIFIPQSAFKDLQEIDEFLNICTKKTGSKIEVSMIELGIWKSIDKELPDWEVVLATCPSCHEDVDQDKLQRLVLFAHLLSGGKKYCNSCRIRLNSQHNMILVLVLLLLPFAIVFVVNLLQR